MEAKIEQQRLEIEQHRKEKEATMEQELAAFKDPAPAITDEQLAALQARIEGLHVTKLLADEELFALEDLIADYVELTIVVNLGEIGVSRHVVLLRAGWRTKCCVATHTSGLAFRRHDARHC